MRSPSPTSAPKPPKPNRNFVFSNSACVLQAEFVLLRNFTVSSFFRKDDCDEKLHISLEIKRLKCARSRSPRQSPEPSLSGTTPAASVGTDVHIYHGEPGSARGASARRARARIRRRGCGGRRRCHRASGRRPRHDRSQHLLRRLRCLPERQKADVQPYGSGRRHDERRIRGVQHRARRAGALRLHPDVPLEYGRDERAACLLHPRHRPRRNQGRRARSAWSAAGAIGLLLVQLAKLSGAAKVVLSEPNAIRREKARQLGADLCIDPLSENSFAEYLEFVGGERGRRGDRMRREPRRASKVHSAL